MENPAWRLVPIVNRLFELGGDDSLSARSREAALAHARQLRAQLVALVERQFPAPSPLYSQALEEMAAVTPILESVRTNPGLAAGAFQRADQLIATIEKLLAA